MLLAIASGAMAEEEDDEELFPGLIAGYEASGQTVERVDPDIAFDWGDASPDPQLPAGNFLVDWTGLLLLKNETKYRFHAWIEGNVTVEVDARVVLAGGSRKGGWISGDAVALPIGEQPFRVSYRRTGKGARLKLYWSSDAFALEPIPEHLLFHDEDQIATRVGTRGGHYFTLLRCNRCHRREGEPVSPPGPSLTRLGGQPASALVDQIERPAVERGHTRMPKFGFTRDEATSIAAYLLSVAETPKLEKWTAPKVDAVAKQQQAGATLFRSIGCLTCHAMEGEADASTRRLTKSDEGGLSAAADLTTIGRRRSAEWLHTWLKDPERLNADHQMPVFRLSDAERQQLTAFLSSRTSPPRPADAPPDATKEQPASPDIDADILKSPERIAAGKELATKARCAACHQIKGLSADLAGVPALDERGRNWLGACLNRNPDRETLRPSYESAFNEALGVFLNARAAAVSAVGDFDRGRALLEEKRCLGCHERGTSRGIAAFAGAIAAADPALQGQSEALIPPALTAAGDKLTDKALAEAITGGLEKPRLPWLRVRMPKFRHTDEERAALASYLIGHDRIPDKPPPHRDGAGDPNANAAPSGTPLTAERLLIGQNLVGPRGFSCIACHEVGSYKPKNVALGTRGSDLLALGSRMRREYYVRWTRSPARIVPGMEMPSYIKAVPTVLDETVDTQLLATWDALNDARFTPPTNPTAVEQLLVVEAGKPARIVRDVFTLPAQFGAKNVARSFAVGLNNGHNLLYDLDTFTLRQWTFGDFARQRTEGKSWYWDMAGTPVISACSRASDFALENIADPKSSLILPTPAGIARGRLLGYRTTEAGVELEYEVRFQLSDHTPPIAVAIRETIAPKSPDANSSQFVRTIRAANVPAGFALRVAAHQSERALGNGVIAREGIDADSDWANWPADNESLDESVERRSVTARATDKNGGQEVTLRYVIDLKPDRLPLPQKPVFAPPAEAVTTVPGYDGVRLPLDRSIMPTALAWTASGQFVFTSLKGHVFLASDTDRDGIEDTLSVVEEGLAAPYGIFADGDDLLVSHKPDVVRLNGAGAKAVSRTVQREVFAAGWGYSDNYHDWTCGIVRDSAGNFYVGTGSDYAQNDRAASTGKWRGKVLRITPKGEVTAIAHALRYPTGLAFDGEGRLFATDNQGVQNTFNELNHIVEGRSYGVPARFEEQRDAPATIPAVQIPHPWTRSVNGIAFLPALNPPLAAKRSDPKTPFAGHTIGCDYDTRTLVRFTIQQVGEVVQGAAYPFSLPDQGAGGKNFTGPLSIGVAPNGDIFIGSIHDSGWLGGLNTGDIVRLRANGSLPNGIREVRATREGFDVEFIHPVNPARAADVKNFSVSGYTRVWKGAYATPDSGRHAGEIESAALSDDRRRVSLKLNNLREGCVYEIGCRRLSGDESTSFFPAEAHYTLHKKP